MSDGASTILASETLTGDDLREVMRVEAIHRWQVLQAPPDAFSPVTSLAAKVFGVPYGTICIIDDEHTWFVDPFGFSLDKIPNHPGLCCSVVKVRAPLFLPDARDHAESATHPLVTGEFGMRFYSGVPLRTREGHHVGTLAVFDKETLSINEAQRQMLIDLAAVIVREIEVRVEAIERAAEEDSRQRSEHVRVTNLEQALGTQGVIGQAMGVLMARHGYDSRQAFAALRKKAEQRGSTVPQVAQALMDTLTDGHNGSGPAPGQAD
jgi:GAF domain-containing protein